MVDEHHHGEVAAARERGIACNSVTDEASRILDAALQLPKAERAEIAAILIDSIGDGSSPEEIEAAWIAEAKRRSEAIARGEMELVDSDEMMARLRARVQRSQERHASTR